MSNLREIVERMLADFDAKDMDAIAAIMHPKLIYRVSGQSVISGEYRGVEGWRELSKRSTDETGNTRQYETKAVMYGDTQVAMLSRATGKRRGKELNVDVIILYRFEDGLMIEADLVPIDQYAFDEFWAE